MGTGNNTAKKAFLILLSVLMVLTTLPMFPGMLLRSQAYGDTDSASATIIWNDGSASDRPEPEVVASWLHLQIDGTEVTGFTPEVSDNGNDSYSVLYSNLPLSSGTEQTYQITEVIPEDYSDLYSSSSSNSGNTTTITNLRLTSVSVSKNWVGIDETERTADMALWRSSADESDQDTGLIIHLDGTADSDLKSASGAYSGVFYSEDSAWHGLFTRLPAYDEDGGAITYYVYENGEAGSSGEEAALADCYSPIITGNMDSGFTVTNISKETCSIRVKKIWKGTPENVTVNLLADGGEFLTAELDGTADNVQIIPDYNIVYGETTSWIATFDNLPKYSPLDGHEIQYTVSEEQISGVTAVTSEPQPLDASSSLVQYTITNTRAASVIPTVQKQWKDGVGQESVELALQRKNGNSWISVESITLDGTADAADGQTGEYADWKGRFGAVEKYDDQGTEYTYRVVENTVGNWYAVCSGSLDEGFTVTNYPAGTVSVTPEAEKRINTYEEPGDQRFAFQLTEVDARGNAVSGGVTQIVANHSDGSITFDPIVYTAVGDHHYKIAEIVPQEATDVQNNNDITTFTLHGKSYIMDPSYIMVDVSITSTGSSLSSEVNISRAGSDYQGRVFNNFTATKKAVSVVKMWEPSAPADAKVYVRLYQQVGGSEPKALGPVVEMDGKADESEQAYSISGITLFTYKEDAPWHLTFRGLDSMNPSGLYNQYSVKETDSSGNTVETPVAGYSSRISGSEEEGFVITNTRLVTIKFKKSWNVSEAFPMPGITVQLEQYDTETNSWNPVPSVAAVTLNGSETPTAWAGSFTDLPRYDRNGNTIRYRVVETDVPDGYICSGVTGNMADGFTITNVQATELRFQKIWVGDAPTGATATFQLYRSTDGTKYGSADSTAQPWGPAITLDGKADASAAQDSATGVVTQEYEDNWYGRFSRLPIRGAADEVYTYSIRETSSVSGYSALYDYSSIPASVINYPSKAIEVTKQWCGGTAQPISIGIWSVQSGSASGDALYTVHLDGTADEVPEDTGIGIFGYEAQPWHAVFLNVPDLTEISYTVAETDTPDGFISKLSTDGNDAIVNREATIKNISTEKVNIEVQKSWIGQIPADGTSIEIALYNGGTEPFKTVTLDGKADAPSVLPPDGISCGEFTPWVASFNNLSKCNQESGEEYTYTVKELNAADGYINSGISNADTEGNTVSYTITNVEETHLFITKTWKGEIPENATVTLQLFRSRDGTLATDVNTTAEQSGGKLGIYDPGKNIGIVGWKRPAMPIPFL